MIKFFRKIRLELLSNNKVSKYLIYAIGEIVLVVIGILIALSINNWNEGKKTEHNRQVLIASLIEDFKYTYDDIVNDELPYLKSLKNDIDRFKELSGDNSQLVPVDSLKALASSYFRPNYFNPNLTAYNDAVSSGNLGLLKNKELKNQFTRFMQFLNVYNNIEDQSEHSYYNGAYWEFRKTIDPDLLSRTSMSTITHEDYHTLTRTPLALNTFKNHELLNKGKYNNILKMSEIIERILDLLINMQEGVY